MDTDLAIDLWLDALASENRSPETLRNYRSHCRALPGVLPRLDPRGQPSLRRFLASYGSGHAPDSARSVFIAWRAFFNWCVREGMVPESPMRGMRQPRCPESTREGYSAGQMQALFAYLETVRTPVGLRNYAACAMLLDLGLRASELCRLTIDDLTDDGAVIVRLSKTGRPRVVPMGVTCNRAVRRYLAFGRPKFPPRSAALLVNQYGAGLNRWGIQSMLDRTANAVGFHLNAHRFRHQFATNHLRAGTPTETLRRLGGWQTTAMLARYGHLVHEDLRDTQLRVSVLDRMR